MDRTSIRAWRRIQKKRVWYKRLRLIFSAFTLAQDRQKIKNWKDLRNEHWCQVYRTTGQPCSCDMCTGERYNRRDFKAATASLIRDTD